MIAVVYGALFALGCALVGIAVDWRRLRASLPNRKRQPVPVTRSAIADRLLTDGWPPALVSAVLYTGPVNVTAKTHANGTTQVWLKRPAA